MKAVVRYEKVLLRTYPYSDPAPLPEFGRIYPYNRFDGYAFEGKDEYWDMIVMENQWVKLWINPAVGGKVWGAVEKSTGKEFIYFNHAAKFRDVAMRGPWTSGGIEFNVGILGHTLSCASPVDHHTRANADGSVSCFIGATDWPSRTRWFVEISLTDEAAWFRTRTSWYNNSGEDQSYYSWSNAGVKTSGDLEYVFPGQAYLGHDGRAHSWPVDTRGRDLSKYDNNDFGHYKSYHVFGSSSDFWGCYWRKDDLGLGHYSPYDQKPGKKIWIWGLSRYGMIWEDLLTDSDGQYSEVQSGRLFNQSISASSATPFKHRSFLPCAFDAWDEYWMPVKGMGGLAYACPELSFFVDADRCHICAHQPLVKMLKAEDRRGGLVRVFVDMKAMENTVLVLSRTPEQDSLRLWLDDVLIYDAGEQQYQLRRPTEIASGYDHDGVEGLYLQGKEWLRQRFFARAVGKYTSCLDMDPFYVPALLGMAALKLRWMDDAESLSYLTKALSVDSYDGEANYLYGLVNFRLGNLYDAKDGFSIAAQSMAYRTAALTELAKMMVRAEQYSKALGYVDEALVYNARNCQAYQLQVVIYRKTGREEAARQLAEQRLQDDPLDHVLRAEIYMTGKDLSVATFAAGISSEWPQETFLEVASFYADIFCWAEAGDLLRAAPEHPMVRIWKAWIHFKQGHDADSLALPGELSLVPGEGVFPHRHDDITVLRWAMSRTDCWQVKYFLALGLVQMMKEEEALRLLEACGDEPPYYSFYLLRSGLKDDGEADLIRAAVLAPQAWRVSMQLSKYYAGHEEWERAIGVLEEVYKSHQDNYYVGLQLAKCHMYGGQFEAGISLMKGIRVLPNEGASEGRNVWRETNLHAAVAAIGEGRYEVAANYIRAARTWPENIGVGRPYDVDERLEDYLDWYCSVKVSPAEADGFRERIISFREKYPEWPVGSNDVLALVFLRDRLNDQVFDIYRQTWLDPRNEALPVRWANAFLDGDAPKVERLSEERIVPPVVLPYEIPFEDREFMIIKKIYVMGLLTIKN